MILQIINELSKSNIYIKLKEKFVVYEKGEKYSNIKEEIEIDEE